MKNLNQALGQVRYAAAYRELADMKIESEARAKLIEPRASHDEIIARLTSIESKLDIILDHIGHFKMPDDEDIKF